MGDKDKEEVEGHGGTKYRNPSDGTENDEVEGHGGTKFR